MIKIVQEKPICLIKKIRNEFEVSDIINQGYSISSHRMELEYDDLPNSLKPYYEDNMIILGFINEYFQQDGDVGIKHTDNPYGRKCITFCHYFDFDETMKSFTFNIDGEEFEIVEGMSLIFDGSKEHHYVKCDGHGKRFLLNIVLREQKIYPTDKLNPSMTNLDIIRHANENVYSLKEVMDNWSWLGPRIGQNWRMFKALVQSEL